MEQKADKRKIIYENNKYVNDYTKIISILDKHKCKYTKNSNGIFINLTTLSDKIIDDIYPFFVNNTLEDYQQNEYSTEVIQETIDTETITNYEKRNIDKQTYTIPIHQFSIQEQKIISYSNNYILS